MLFLKQNMRMVNLLIMNWLCWKRKVIHYFQFILKMSLVETSGLINPYKEPELIQDYQTKNKININTFINKYLSKDGIKLVSKLNNKIIVQNEEVINLFTLKNESDAHRLIENLTERFVRLKRGDCMFVLDISSPQRKYLYTLLKEKGFNLDYLYRKETTY